MANFDATTAAAQQATSYKMYETMISPLVRKKVFSFADLAAVKGSAVASGDTYDLLPIFAGELVVGTYIRVITADGSASTLALGDQSAASFQAATALNATAGTVVGGSGAYLQSGTTPFAITGGKYYSAANTLRATVGGTAGTAAVFEVVMAYLPMGTLATV